MISSWLLLEIVYVVIYISVSSLWYVSMVIHVDDDNQQCHSALVDK
jgi:hypothetical protein